MGRASRNKAERRHANHRCLRCKRPHDWTTSLLCRRCRSAAVMRPGAEADPAYDRRMLALLLEAYDA